MKYILDHIDAETFSPLGDMPIVQCDVADASEVRQAAILTERAQAVVIGVDRAGAAPLIDERHFDCLVTVAPKASRPWVSLSPARLDGELRAIFSTVHGAPHAAGMLTQLLRVGGKLSFGESAALESMAYSALLAGAAFRNWRNAAPVAKPTPRPAYPVRITRDGDVLTIILASPQSRNTTDARMRDALWEALAAALDDPTRPEVRLMGEGKCFSAGGVLAEFGTATDLAAAHSIRIGRSCASLLHALGQRAQVVLHGACIGAGIEIPAAAAFRSARANTFVQLPELGMGLIPGAGGTVSLPRAIGRHRTAYLCLSGKRISAAVAASWGLFDLID